MNDENYEDGADDDVVNECYSALTWFGGGGLCTIWRQRWSGMPGNSSNICKMSELDFRIYLLGGNAGYFVHFLLCRGPIGPCEAPYVWVKSVFLIDCFVTKCCFARSNLFTRWPSHYSCPPLKTKAKPLRTRFQSSEDARARGS